MGIPMLDLFRGRIVLFLYVLAISALMAQSSASAANAYVYETRFTAGDPIVSRYGHVTLPLGDGRVGVFGGVGLTAVELFDPATELFSPTRATRWFADPAGAILPYGNALLVDGRQDAIFDPLVEQFLPTTNTYTGGSVRSPVLVPLPDGRVFVCGGSDSDSEPKAACGVFEPRALRFEPLGDLAVPRAKHTAVLLDDREVLIAGGYGYQDGAWEQGALDSLELFDTYPGRSARIRAYLQQARYDHCSVRLADGRVLLLGGSHSPKEPSLRSTEIFDPRTAAVTAGPELGLGRSGAWAVTLPSGRIAVLGGRDDARAVEVYDSSTGSFVLAGSLTLSPRSSAFTATGLNSGGVLLVGGRVNDGQDIVQKAEILEETTADAPISAAMTPARVKELLTDRDENVVRDTAEQLAELGPLVMPIIQAFLEDESAELRRRAREILQSIDQRTYEQVWCVEVWDAHAKLATLWLSGFECPERYDAANPDRHVATILTTTEKMAYTSLVVRFPVYASYRTRVELFNLVGWTRIPKVVLGTDLDAESLSRASDPLKK